MNKQKMENIGKRDQSFSLWKTQWIQINIFYAKKSPKKVGYSEGITPHGKGGVGGYCNVLAIT